METARPYLRSQQDLAHISATPVYRMGHRVQQINYTGSLSVFTRVGGQLMTTGMLTLGGGPTSWDGAAYRPVTEHDIYAFTEANVMVVTDAATARSVSAYAKSVAEGGPDGSHRISFGVTKAYAMRGISFGLLLELSSMARSFYVIPKEVKDALGFTMNRMGLPNDLRGHLKMIRSLCLSSASQGLSQADVTANGWRTTASKAVELAGVVSIADLGYSGEVSNSRHFVASETLSSLNTAIEQIDAVCRHFYAETGDVVRLEPDTENAGAGSMVVVGNTKANFEKMMFATLSGGQLTKVRLKMPTLRAETMVVYPEAVTTNDIAENRSRKETLAVMLTRGGWAMNEPFVSGSVPKSTVFRKWGNDPALSGNPMDDIPCRAMPLHIAVAGGGA